MKKILFLVLALVLASCAPAAPVAQPTAIPPTPVVLVATVLVPVVQTQIVQATAAPTNPPAPTEPPAPTATVAAPVAPTAAPATAAANPQPAAGGTATATLPADAGGNLFTNLTRSGSYFNFRCLPQELTFGVSTANYAVVEVDFWYRFEDLTTQPITYSEWKNLGKMNTDKNGNFTITFNTSQINPDIRAAAKGWIDYQFVGVSKAGDAVGRSGKISQQILYLKDCP